eukprot:scaffold458828_cov11-Prasinocladus_malaysianus.AAC.1
MSLSSLVGAVALARVRGDTARSSGRRMDDVLLLSVRVQEIPPKHFPRSAPSRTTGALATAVQGKVGPSSTPTSTRTTSDSHNYSYEYSYGGREYPIS